MSVSKKMREESAKRLAEGYRERRAATRTPRPPPFRVGARVRYRGEDQVTMNGVVVLAPGLVVEIVEARQGRRGSGRPVDLGDGDPFIDTTRDGSNVYEVGGLRRLIHARDAHEWEVKS